MDLNKITFEQFIHRYYLGGLYNSATIKSTGKAISTRVATQVGDCYIELSTDEIALPEGEYHIYDSAALLAILGVLGGHCSVIANTNKDGVPTSLAFDDGKVKATYVLAYGSVIHKASAIKIMPPVDIGHSLLPDFGVLFSKAYGALSEAKFFAVQSDGTIASLTLNYEEKRNTTRVTLPLTGAAPNVTIPTLYFSAEHMAAILKINAASVKEGKGKIEVSNIKSGFAQISFPEFNTNYYLIGNTP